MPSLSRTVRALVAGAVLPAALLPAAAVAAAPAHRVVATAVPAPSVQPAVVAPGHEVTVSGAGCGPTRGRHGSVTVSVMTWRDDVVAEVGTPADAAGRWSAEVTLPRFVPAHDYLVEAVCNDEHFSAPPPATLHVRVPCVLSVPAPAPVDFGDAGTLTLSGRADGHGLDHAVVQLWSRAVGAPAFRELAVVHTDGSGRASVHVHPRVSTQYQFRTGAVGTAAAAGASPVQTVWVARAVGLREVRAGRRTVLTGSVAPVTAGTVTLQRARAGHWTTVRRIRLGAHGYRAVVTAPGRYRVLAPATATAVAGHSRVVQVAAPRHA